MGAGSLWESRLLSSRLPRKERSTSTQRVSQDSLLSRTRSWQPQGVCLFTGTLGTRSPCWEMRDTPLVGRRERATESAREAAPARDGERILLSLCRQRNHRRTPPSSFPRSAGHMDPRGRAPLLLLAGCLALALAWAQCPEECTCSRSAQVECSRPHISAMPGPLPANAMSLQVIGTQLTELGAGAFGNASLLIALRMEKNSLARLNPDTFRGLVSLRYLSLSSNRLQELPAGVFRSLDKLESLLLSGNQLLRLHPAHFSRLGALKELQLHGNSLASVPPGAFDHLPSLLKLNLAKNRLSRLPPGLFAHLGHLQVLRLYENQLAEVAPRAFTALPDLQELGLHQNRIRHLPDGLLSANRRLQKLHLSNNRLESVPQGLLLELPELSRLSLFGNALRELLPATFGPMPRLKELWLYDNQLADVPAGVFANLTELQLLVLSRNRLRSVSPLAFEGLGELLEISLHTNQLHTLDGETFRGLGKLQNVSLQNNRLVSLPERLFRSTPHLVNLQLHNNSLESLPAGIFEQLPRLREIKMHDNPWRCDDALLALGRWLRENGARLGASLPVCAWPPSLQGQPIAELEEEHFGPAQSPEATEGPTMAPTSGQAEVPDQDTSPETVMPTHAQPPLDHEGGSAEAEQEFSTAATGVLSPGVAPAEGGIWGLTRTQTGVVVTCLVVGSALLLGALLAGAVYGYRRKARRDLAKA